MGKRGPSPGTGGRPSKPLADKIAEGNPGKRPLKVMEFIRKQRYFGKLSAYFTIDAGANIHVLCRKEDHQQTLAQLRLAFSQFDLIEDETGEGPTLHTNG